MRFLGRSGDRSEPVAAEFAGVLDGRTLWLAVRVTSLPDPVGGTADDARWALELRTGSGSTTDLGAVIEGGYLHARAPLPDAPGSYDVLATHGETSRRVTRPRQGDGPTRIPASGHLQAELESDDEGLLITVRTAEPAAEVLSISSDRERVTVVVAGEGPARLAFMAKGDEVGSLPLVAGDRGLEATISPEDVPAADVRLMLSGTTGRLPVRRAANALATPDKAVLLPRLEDPDGAPLLVCAWTSVGDLRMRRPAHDPGVTP